MYHRALEAPELAGLAIQEESENPAPRPRVHLPAPPKNRMGPNSSQLDPAEPAPRPGDAAADPRFSCSASGVPYFDRRLHPLVWVRRGARSSNPSTDGPHELTGPSSARLALLGLRLSLDWDLESRLEPKEMQLLRNVSGIPHLEFDVEGAAVTRYVRRKWGDRMEAGINSSPSGSTCVRLPRHELFDPTLVRRRPNRCTLNDCRPGAPGALRFIHAFPYPPFVPRCSGRLGTSTGRRCSSSANWVQRRGKCDLGRPRGIWGSHPGRSNTTACLCVFAKRTT